MNSGFNLFTILKISNRGSFADLHTLYIFAICNLDLHKMNHGNSKEIEIVGLVPVFSRSSP